MADDELETLRAAIDEIDRAIVEQLARRRAAVDALAHHKRAADLPATDAAREERLRDLWRAEAEARRLPTDVALAVLEAVLTTSRRRVAEVVASPGSSLVEAEGRGHDDSGTGVYPEAAGTAKV